MPPGSFAHACEIDYPKDRIEIQVLDDSTDESAAVVHRACEEMAAQGHAVHHLHRDTRTGYKSGALAEGMNRATGEFIAIFDADFVPTPDALRGVMDHFVDPKVGLVQLRWDHINRNASILTKCQAIFLDAHFAIEQAARNFSGRFMHFNGTAGIWRRSCIEDAGGWRHDTLTEDLDLSYRAQLKGWRFIYLPQFSVPAELPPETIGFKQQAHRWTKGSIQTCIKLLPRVMVSPLPLSTKVEAFFHLTSAVVYPMIMLLTALMFPCFLIIHARYRLFGERWTQYLFGASLLMALATCSASLFFIYGQKELFGRRAGWNTILYLPVLMALGAGISLSNSEAMLEAIWGAIRRRPGEFIRTRKYGEGGHKDSQQANRSFSISQIALSVLEISFGFYASAWIAVSIYYRFCMSSAPFLAIFAAGYLVVGFSSAVLRF